jgi:hypothetical protein
MNTRVRYRVMMLMMAMIVITVASTRLQAETGTCGGQMLTLPFTDVNAGNIFSCSIAEAYFSALTNGTTPTTYSPAENVPREQMAAFITRTLDQSLKRGSRRAALKQWWTPAAGSDLASTIVTTVGASPQLVESDGVDLWVTNYFSNSVSRVRASDGKLLETWTVPTFPVGVLAAKGRIFIAGNTNPGQLCQIDPRQPVGPVTTLTNSRLGVNPNGIAFDGSRVWTANFGAPGSVSIVTLDTLTVTTVTAGFSSPIGILYDGANIWVTDPGDSSLKKLDANGNIIQTVTVGSFPRNPVFDGTNIWVPNRFSNTVTVVRAATGAVLATLSGNGLDQPATAAFDGERILITDLSATADAVSLWKAADLTPLGSIPTGPGTNPFGACSDGLNFWIAFNGNGKLARF